jgi:hypothetical protein
VLGQGLPPSGSPVPRPSPGAPEEVERGNRKTGNTVRYYWFCFEDGLCLKRRAPSALTQDSSGSMSATSSVPPPCSSSDEPVDAGPWTVTEGGVGVLAPARCRWCEVLVKRRRERKAVVI